MQGKTGKKRFLSLCGGTGRCGRCRVKIVSEDREAIEEPSLTEKQLLGERVKENIRLACQFIPTESLRIIPIDFQELQVSNFKTQDSYQNFCLNYPFKPRFVVISVSLAPATLEAPLDDFTRLKQAIIKQLPEIPELTAKITTMNGLYRDIRKGRVRVIIDRTRQKVMRMNTLGDSDNSRLLGVVVDIGTTSIVSTLIDLESGLILGADSILNPQIRHGRDVMSRLSFALQSSSQHKELQEEVFSEIQNMIKRMITHGGREIQENSSIAELVVVGNSVMHHLFLNLSIDGLAKAPYVPIITQGISYSVDEIDATCLLGLPSNSIISLPPLIGGFIGSDAVVDILYSGLSERKGIHLLIDFGTNSEIILVKDGAIYAASVAAGGAFEGQHISCGMRGIPGAIESFWIIDGTYHYLTIGSFIPKGICGSGIIDILASLRVHSQLDERGRLFDKKGELVSEVILAVSEDHKQLSIIRKDVVEIQKAKAATLAAIQALTSHTKVTIDQIETVHIAGVFGSKLNIKNAITIGLLPDLPLSRFFVHGNTAERGGRAYLLSVSARKAAEAIAMKVRRVELSTVSNFQKLFTEELFFPPLKRSSEL